MLYRGVSLCCCYNTWIVKTVVVVARLDWSGTLQSGNVDFVRGLSAPSTGLEERAQRP